MATPASRKPRERKTLWQRFLSFLIPPWFQVAAVILCSGIVYLAELWVQPDRARLKAEKQSSQIIRNQLLDLESYRRSGSRIYKRGFVRLKGKRWIKIRIWRPSWPRWQSWSRKRDGRPRSRP